MHFPGDQRAFRQGVAVCAVRRVPGFGRFICPTGKDNRIDDENLELLSRGLVKLAAAYQIKSDREKYTMGIYEELQARGLIAQVTNEPEIREMVNNGKATFYIGFDPTADSLHVGHFMALCLMKRLQMAGNRPVVLVGGGTGYIGDPSGRSDMRSMMTPETIQHNCDCFKKQMERFIDFGEGKAIMVNNADWLMKLNYIELLREVGACFCVNNMLRARVLQAADGKGA